MKRQMSFWFHTISWASSAALSLTCGGALLCVSATDACAATLVENGQAKAAIVIPAGQKSPKGEAVRKGWIYQREFAHASVFVDLEKKSAGIDWR